MKKQILLILVSLITVILCGCSSTGNLGIITRSSANPGAFLTESQRFKELGPTEGKACRHFVLAIAPFGKSDMEAAVDDALQMTGGDALVNVSVESNLYGFVPIYNIYSFTCTTVRGTAIKFE